MTKWSAIALFITLLLAAAACTTTSNSAGQLNPIEADIATTTAPTTQPPSTEAEPTPARVDVDALLIQYGFERCGHNEPNDSLTDERREELFQTTSAGGLTISARLDHHPSWLRRHVPPLFNRVPMPLPSTLTWLGHFLFG